MTTEHTFETTLAIKTADGLTLLEQDCEVSVALESDGDGFEDVYVTEIRWPSFRRVDGKLINVDFRFTEAGAANDPTLKLIWAAARAELDSGEWYDAMKLDSASDYREAV